MADKTVSLEIKVDATGAAQSVGDLKKSISDLKNKALQAGENTLLGKEFLKQAGEAKDKLADLNRQVDNFQDAGAKFGAVTKLVGGLAAGFQAAQGAAALFGVAGKDIEQVMLKVQSATALAQGVQGIAGLGESFKDVGAIIKGPLNAAFTTLKGAMIATGIGAFAVVVGLLYQNFDKVKTVLANIIPLPVQKAFGVLKDAIGSVVDGVKNLVGLGDGATSVLKTMGTFGTFLNNTLKNTKEIQQDGFKAIKDYNDQLKAQQEYIKSLTEAGAVGSIGYYSFLLGKSNEQLNKLVPGTDAYNKELNKNYELQLKIADAEEKKKRPKDEIQKIGQKTQELTSGVVEQKQAEFKQLSDIEFNFQDMSLSNLKKFEDNKTFISTLSATRREEFEKAIAAKRLAREKAIVDYSKMGLNILSSLGEIFIRNAAKQEKFQKKIAATQLLIDTASGISSVVREASKAGFPAAIPIIIGGVAMVLGNIAKAKAILSKAGDVSVPSLDSGGAVGAGGGAQPNAPTLNQPTTNIPQGQQTTPPDTKVYVTETDIKRVINRVNVIESRARFG